MPIEEDTIWIECTNQRIPFGYNSTFTDDRDVLLINETGGHLVHTRIFDASVNYRKRNILISVTPDGNAGIKINTEYSGSFFDDHFSLIGADNERRKKMISEQFAISGLLLDSMDIKSTKSRLPALRERLTGSVPRYSNITGSRMLVQFNRLFDLPKPPKNVNNRKSAVYIRRSYTQQDSVQIMIPEDFSVESLPSDTVIISRFGECRYSYLQTDASHVRYCRVLTVRAGEYDAEQYKEFRGFVSSLSYHDGLKMCLKKKG